MMQKATTLNRRKQADCWLLQTHQDKENIVVTPNAIQQAEYMSAFSSRISFWDSLVSDDKETVKQEAEHFFSS